LKATSSAQFNPLYLASRDLAVQALFQMTDQGARWAAGIALQLKGHAVDPDIDASVGYDPFEIMRLRESYGYTWQPNILQPRVMEAPGINTPFTGVTPYDPSNPLPGSIKVSIEIGQGGVTGDWGDYPPFNPPAPTPLPVHLKSFVGNPIGALWNGLAMYMALGVGAALSLYCREIHLP
jgi:hypothetical protein